VYVSGKKMHAQFTTSVAGQSMTTNVINTGSENFIWGKSAMGDMAMKFAVDPEQADAQSAQQFNLDQDVNYKCSPWRFDETMFEPPADIKFSDMSAMMKQAMPSSVDMESFANQQCVACAQIGDGNAKQECLLKFQCN
jgi:hypothetical protein